MHFTRPCPKSLPTSSPLKEVRVDLVPCGRTTGNRPCTDSKDIWFVTHQQHTVCQTLYNSVSESFTTKTISSWLKWLLPTLQTHFGWSFLWWWPCQVLIKTDTILKTVILRGGDVESVWGDGRNPFFKKIFFFSSNLFWELIISPSRLFWSECRCGSDVDWRSRRSSTRSGDDWVDVLSHNPTFYCDVGLFFLTNNSNLTNIKFWTKVPRYEATDDFVLLQQNKKDESQGKHVTPELWHTLSR